MVKGRGELLAEGLCSFAVTDEGAVAKRDRLVGGRAGLAAPQEANEGPEGAGGLLGGARTYLFDPRLANINIIIIRIPQQPRREEGRDPMNFLSNLGKEREKFQNFDIRKNFNCSQSSVEV